MYGKLFASMFRGSLYGKWQAIQQMIILADKDGTVDFTLEALHATTSIPIDILREGISLLEAPDRTSRTPTEDGRRIVLVDENRPWGWRIVNYAKYRAIRTAEERREYHKQYWHDRKKVESQQINQDQQNQPIAEAVSSKHKQDISPRSLTKSHQQCDGVNIDLIHEKQFVQGLDVNAWKAWVEYRKKIRKAIKPPSIALAQKQMAELGLDQMSAVENSIANGWQGLFAKGVKNGSHQRIDNSAPARVELAIAEKRRQRNAIDAESERVD